MKTILLINVSEARVDPEGFSFLGRYTDIRISKFEFSIKLLSLT